VRLLVQRDALTNTVAQILAQMDVLDLTISDPPIEEVIGRVFTAGTVN
jgi:ABC-2 type transport system ATP-binding protein